jgi:hypothetical protein
MGRPSFMANFDENPDDAQVLGDIIAALRRLSPESRKRVLDTVGTFFGDNVIFNFGARPHPASPHSAGTGSSGPSEPQPVHAKHFITDKAPKTDVERVACLAYYLTHYANAPHFKTVDLSRLNTEAAQPKFSNAAVAVENATKMGYLVPAIKGHKQISAAGERFVQALPDREAAKQAMSAVRSRMKRRNSTKKNDGA